MSKIQMESFPYSSETVPSGYICGKCGKAGVKLWRDYQTFLENQSITCVHCACEAEGKVDDMDGGGISESRGTNQIGWRVPAVPTENGTTFWEYSSVPQARVDWWRKLPTR